MVESLYAPCWYSFTAFLTTTHIELPRVQSGSDFDQCVAHVLERKLDGRIVSMEDAKRVVPCGFAAPACALHNLYPLSEGMRRLLTDGDTATVDCMVEAAQRRNLRSQDPMAAVEGGASGRGKGADAGMLEHFEGSAARETCGLWEPFSLQLTRMEYEEQCAGLFDRGVAPVKRLLDRLDLIVDDVDEVVMVGGMTRTPRVRELLKSHLGVERLNVEIDPDVVVAYGAATIAH